MKNFNFVTSSSKDIKIKSEKEAERGRFGNVLKEKKSSKPF